MDWDRACAGERSTRRHYGHDNEEQVDSRFRGNDGRVSAKFGAQRKRAFLTYLAQTGNQTLSAERAKVSRSWVCLHRANDAAFDADCRSAIAVARAALREAASTSSAAPQDERRGHTPHPPTADAAGPTHSPAGRGAKKWKYFDGHELVVRGTGGSGGGKRVQIGRAREKQWTARVEKRFLSALASTCNVKAACAEVGMGVVSAYSHRRRWPLFASAWAKAEETGFLRLEAALVAAAAGIGEEPEFAPDIPIEGMTVWHAMQLFFMHRHQVRGIGGRPGQPPRLLATDEEVVKALTRSLRASGCNVDEALAEIEQRAAARRFAGA
jgi:hypothetical protein